GAPPLRSAPLLYLVGDGMELIAQRLDYVGLFHDLGCRFKGCLGGNAPTRVSQMWRLMAALANPADSATGARGLATEVVSAKMVNAPWSKVCDHIVKAHPQTIQPATADAYWKPSYDPSLLTTGNATTLPSPVLGASRLIQRAMFRRNSYAVSGLFSSNPTN